MWTRSRASCSSRHRRSIDPNFRKTVVLIAHHDDDGAMGLVLSRPSDVAARRRRAGARGLPGADDPVFVGGPVQPEAFMVLAEFDDVDAGGRADHRRRRLHARRGRAGRALDPARFRLFAGLRRLGRRPARGRARGAVVDRRRRRADDAFADDPDELWRTVLHRKGGPFELMVDMPFDPGLN